MEDIIKPSQTDSQDISDKQAITLLKNGKIEGLAALVETYQVKAVHTALLITCDRQLAEDVVQDSFLRVYRKIEQFDEGRPFSPWFLRIVINAAKKAVQRRERFRPLENAEDGNPVAEWLIDPGKSPEKLAVTVELGEQVWQAIGCLTADQREAVILRYFLDSKESEMVRRLGRPSTTIKWRLHAAKQRLRQLLQPVGKREFEKEEISHE